MQNSIYISSSLTRSDTVRQKQLIRMKKRSNWFLSPNINNNHRLSGGDEPNRGGFKPSPTPRSTSLRGSSASSASFWNYRTSVANDGRDTLSSDCRVSVDHNSLSHLINDLQWSPQDQRQKRTSDPWGTRFKPPPSYRLSASPQIDQLNSSFAQVSVDPRRTSMGNYDGFWIGYHKIAVCYVGSSSRV